MSNLKEYFIVFILLFIPLNAVLYLNFDDILKTHGSQITKNVLHSIKEYNELDLQYLCDLTDCKYTRLNNITYCKITNIMKQRAIKPPVIILNDDNYKLTSKLELLIYIKKYKLTILSNTHNIIQEILYGYFYINSLYFIIFSLFYIIISYKKHKKKILDMINTSNVLREKNMQILTENIHHELNTPVAIIDGNLKKLELEMKIDPDACISCQRKYYFDFGEIYANIETINNVLSRMSNFKELKYSNGNKTLMDIIKYSANSMSIYKKNNFKIKLSDDLLKYRLKGPLKNGDLLNIVSNHLKNSIEARSTKISIELKVMNNKGHIFIIDNGSGLIDYSSGMPLKPDKYNNIFKPYYSNKDLNGKFKLCDKKGILKIICFLRNIIPKHNSNVRGIGLYLNKELLLENKGDLKLRETSNKGTVFEIIIPVIKKES